MKRIQRFYFSLVVLSCCGAASTVQAQKKIDETDPGPAPSVRTMAVVPWIFRDGTEGAKRAAKEFLNNVLVRVHVDALSEARVAAAWADGLDGSVDEDRTDLPTPAKLLRLGRKLGVDWVMAGRARWHSRSIWVGLGPKTKSTCTVDVLIVDVKNAELALEARNVVMDSTAKEDTIKALGTIFVSYWFTVLSGGPKTPHEQRAVQLAMAKAMEPWLVQQTRTVKIEPIASEH